MLLLSFPKTHTETNENDQDWLTTPMPLRARASKILRRILWGWQLKLMNNVWRMLVRRTAHWIHIGEEDIDSEAPKSAMDEIRFDSCKQTKFCQSSINEKQVVLVVGFLSRSANLLDANGGHLKKFLFLQFCFLFGFKLFLVDILADQ